MYAGPTLTNVTADSSTHTSISLNWTTADVINFYPFNKFYWVIFSMDDVVHYLITKEMSIIVTGLDPDTEYSFSVQAIAQIDARHHDLGPQYYVFNHTLQLPNAVTSELY